MQEKIPEMEVSEAPGLYGTFRVEEKLIQKIWHDQEFIKGKLQTSDGKSLEIINLGK